MHNSVNENSVSCSEVANIFVSLTALQTFSFSRARQEGTLCRGARWLEEERRDGLSQLPVKGLEGELQQEPTLHAINQIILYTSA